MSLNNFKKKMIYAIKDKLLDITARRYRNLYRLIIENRCKRILEIGTWNGEHAKKMIYAATTKNAVEEIEYYGFDLFEDATSELLEEEFAKKPPTRKALWDMLKQTGANIYLYKGNTRVTLPKYVKDLPLMDFIFIDGGHSIETIQNDWNNVKSLMKENTIVIFDDYLNRTDVGCKKIINDLDKNKYDIKILDPKDRFLKKWHVLEINFVKVKLKL